MSIPLAAGMNADFTRQYNSLDLTPEPLGRGWSQTLPSLAFRQVASPENPNSYYTKAALTLGGSQAEFTQSSDGFLINNHATLPSALKAWGVFISRQTKRRG